MENPMKKLFIAIAILSSVCVNAQLIGGMQGKDSRIFIDIFDYQSTGTVSFEVRVNEGQEDLNDRQLFSLIPVDGYIDMFLSDKVVEVSGQELSYKASGTVNNRNIEITQVSLDDNGEIAAKKVAKIKIKGDTGSVEVKAFGRTQFLFWVGDLKEKSSAKATGLSIQRDGVVLYGDNRGWPLGKVTTLGGLLRASADTSTRGLKNACEAECNQ